MCPKLFIDWLLIPGLFYLILCYNYMKLSLRESEDLALRNKRLDGNYFFMALVPIAFLITSLVSEGFMELLEGLYNIILTKDILLTDYLEISGLGATFLNASLVGFMGILLLYRYDMEIDGLAMASIFTVIGFAFIGKNVLNVLPIYLGGFVYSWYNRVHIKNALVPVIFATTLSPVISEVIFAFGIKYIYSIPLGILMGVVIGFIVTPLGKHMSKFHDGYNLYNIGFTGGIIATVITSIFRSFGLPMETQFIISSDYSNYMMLYLLSIFIVMIIIGLSVDRNALKKYRNIFRLSGRAPTNFIRELGKGVTYLNMGIMGIISIVYVLICGGEFSGPVVAGILTVVGFSACGKHPKNTIPILIGVYFTAKINIWTVSSPTILMAALFGTTLAPIAGEFGFFAGVIAGFLHIAVVSNILNSHGGLNLYNNGFSGGIVASVMLPIGNMFKLRREERKRKSCS